MEDTPKIPFVPNDAKAAFEQIFSEHSDLSMEERFDILFEAMVSYSHHLMERQRTTGIVPTETERDFQSECMTQLNLISRCFALARKNGRLPSGKANENVNTELLRKVKTMKGTIGEIITAIPHHENNHEENHNEE